MSTNYEPPATPLADAPVPPRPWFRRPGVWIVIGFFLLILAGFIFVTIEGDNRTLRFKTISAVERLIAGHQERISQFHARNGRLPRDSTEAGMSLAGDRGIPVGWYPIDGELRLTLTDLPGFKGQGFKGQPVTLIYGAVPSDGTLSWKCRVISPVSIPLDGSCERIR